MNFNIILYCEYGKEEIIIVFINDFIKLFKKLRNNYE